MTLNVCLTGKDGIVLASDSRGTFGDPRGVTAQNDSQKKAYVLSKQVGLLAAGSGEIGANLVTKLLSEIQTKRIDGVTPVMDQARHLFRKSYQDWWPEFQIQPVEGVGDPVRPDLAVIVAGYDVLKGGGVGEARMFSLASALDFAPLLHNYGFAVNGIAQYALYLLNRLHKSDSSLDEIKALAAYVITETATQDGKVGGPVQMVVIRPGIDAQELSKTEVDGIVVANEKRTSGLRDLFFERR